ncbi:MAG: histidinol dehydrogenase [Candidatus Saccharibacteria bacterium]|nr:histidinol dehydrogenase [Candidatus Saccharibacteria bacterium]
MFFQRLLRQDARGQIVKQYKNPRPKDWASICMRPVFERASLEDTISKIFEDVRINGDKALKSLTKKYDGIDLANVMLSKEEISELASTTPPDLKMAILTAYKNILSFHRLQVPLNLKPYETSRGVVCWQENKAIEKVGLYIPGGSAPLISTVLMLGIPARLAGCSEVILCTPPSADGLVNPAICLAAQLVGVSKIIRVGGVQAIAGLTFGTESVPAVNKVFGPGNQYVSAAKEYARRYGVGLDLPAGPSEIMVIADETAIPAFVAADLLSQAEHGPDSQVVLVASKTEVIDKVQREILKQLKDLPRREIVIKALENSFCVLFKDVKTAMDFANTYAPEHLILSVANPEKIAGQVINAGSVFLGNFTPESAGDYASGTNHTLPTGGWTKAYGSLGVDDFLKKISFQNISKDGLEGLASIITTIAEAEGLGAHARAVIKRLNFKENI